MSEILFCNITITCCMLHVGRKLNETISSRCFMNATLGYCQRNQMLVNLMSFGCFNWESFLSSGSGMSECSSKLNSWVNSFIYALAGQRIIDLVNENHFMRKLSICTSGFHKTINRSMEFLIRKLFALIVIARVTQHFINKLVPQK